MRRLTLIPLVLIAGCGKITLAPDDMPVVLDDMVAYFGDMGGSDGPTGTVVPGMRINPDVVGFPTTLDGTPSSDRLMRTITYAWHFTKVPAGSRVADACAPMGGFSTCLSSTTDAMPTFEPDLGGDYEVELTVTAGGDSASLKMGFTVPTIPVYAMLGHINANDDNSGVIVVRSDGTGTRDVSCRLSGVTDGGVFNAGNNDPTQPVLFSWLVGGLFGLNSTGAGTSRSYAITSFYGIDGGVSAHLLVGNETSDCNTAPPVSVDDPSLPAGYVGGLFPRFSPDGKRVMYLEGPSNNFASGSLRLVTVAIDGTNPHPMSVAPQIQTYIPPIWLDNSNVAWVEDVNQNDANPSYQIFSHADVAGGPFSGLTPLVDCQSAQATATGPSGQHTDKLYAIEGIGVASLAPLTLVMTASIDPFTDQTQPGPQTIDLYRVTNSPSQCHLDNLTKNINRGWARDFVITPDGKSVYYASTVGSNLDAGGGATPFDIWTVPVDGSQPAAFFTGDARFNDVGPQLVAAGRQIVWTQSAMSANGGGSAFFAAPDAGFSGGGLMIANLDGTHVRSLAAESGKDYDGATSVLGGMNMGIVLCSVVGDSLGDAIRALAGGMAAAILLTVLVVMRRRRAKA